MWCEMPLKQDDRLLVGTVYRSPNSDLANNAEVNEFLSRVVVGKSHVVVCGDFNYPDIDWLEGLSPRDDSHPASKFMDAAVRLFSSSACQNTNPFQSRTDPKCIGLDFHQ